MRSYSRRFEAVDVGEAKQRDIDANAMTKGGPQTLTDEHWSVKMMTARHT